jgi:outer membrane protein TolC
MLEVWDLPVGDLELADREGMYMAGVSQAFPPAGALEGRARAAVERAEEALAEVSDAERAIRARALEACVEWSASHLEIARYREAEAIAERMREAVSARVPSAAASLSELARVDAELARVRRMRVESEVRASRAAAWLRAWLGSDVPATPPSIDPPPPVDGLEAQVSRALERRGTLRAARARARAAASMADAAQAEASVPTFMVEATYMQMPSARPGVGAAIGMTLPWLWSGEGAARDAARAEEDAALEEVAALELEVRAEIGEAAASVESLRRALDELRERERPAAERALEAVTAGLSTGAVDVTAWLDAARALRELEVDEAGLLRELAMAWIELESASGAQEGSE